MGCIGFEGYFVMMMCGKLNISPTGNNFVKANERVGKLTVLTYGYNRSYNAFKIIRLLWPTESDGNE